MISPPLTNPKFILNLTTQAYGRYDNSTGSQVTFYWPGKKGRVGRRGRKGEREVSVLPFLHYLLSLNLGSSKSHSDSNFSAFFPHNCAQEKGLGHMAGPYS